MNCLHIERQWAIPSKHTFTIKPIKTLLNKYVSTELIIVDPFCGEYTIGTITNDMNKDIKADFHLDALEFLKLQSSNIADIVLYDPPYSYRQVKECYNNIGIEKFDPRQTRHDYWKDVKNELARICKLNGIAICCGWNSGGLAKSRGFELMEILLVAHGGSRNDTIVTVERKIK